LAKDPLATQIFEEYQDRTRGRDPSQRDFKRRQCLLIMRQLMYGTIFLLFQFLLRFLFLVAIFDVKDDISFLKH